MKEEEEYLPDFVKYHRSIGVEHFVFLDRTCKDLPALFAGEKDIEIFHFPEEEGNTHMQAWADIISHETNKTFWLACIDADQVLVPVEQADLRQVLREFEWYATVQAHWHTFGSSGYERRVSGFSVYERFLKRAKADHVINHHTQFICRPERVLPFPASDPHHPSLFSEEKQMTTAHKEMPHGAKNNPACHEKIWIAHYLSKSREEWFEKHYKGRSDILGAKMPLELFDDYQKFCNEEEELRVLELWKRANASS